MAYEACVIANYFLRIAAYEKEFLNLMKLEKLIYFSQGWHLAIKKEPLLDEHVESWSYGPVIPSVYYEFKEFGTKEITRQARYFDIYTLQYYIYNIPSDNFVKSLLDRIWEVHRKFTGVQLSNMTHEVGGPWYQTWLSDKRKGTNIPDELLKNWFTSKALSNKKIKK